MEMNNIIDIPKSAVKLSRGFAIDYGATTIRLVYRDKIDASHNDTPRNRRGVLRTAKFKADELDILGKFIKKNCEVDFNHKTIYVTGNICTTLKAIGPDVDFKFEVLSEVECITAALRYLNYRGHEDIFYPITEKMAAQIKKRTAHLALVLEAVKAHSKNELPPQHLPSEDLEVTELNNQGKHRSSISDELRLNSTVFPGIVCVFEEMLNFYYVDYKGRATLMESIDGLESMRALASILTGTTVKDFTALFELINSGDNFHVDTMSGELIVSKPGEDVYSAMAAPDLPAYLLGKCVDKNTKFRPADALRALFRALCITVTQVSNILAQIFKCPSVYVTGFAIDMETAFEEVTVEQTNRETFSLMIPYCLNVKLKCCRHGEYLTALGAYIHSTLRAG